jgi:hypothetical protein
VAVLAHVGPLQARLGQQQARAAGQVAQLRAAAASARASPAERSASAPAATARSDVDTPAPTTRRLRIPLRPLAGREDELAAFYAAYRAFDALLNRPGAMVTGKLAPGDCLIFDNTRVLHARTAFAEATGSWDRHLQGCYADLDSVQWITAPPVVAN